MERYVFITKANNMTKNFISSESNESLLYSVIGADKLLKQSSHQEILKDIQQNIAFSEVRYEILYEPLINSFVEYVQGLHDVGKLSDEQLMNTGLERAYGVTLNYIKDRGQDAEYSFVYALFSAALLLDIGRVDFGRKIMICNKRGVFLKEWQPILGVSLYDDASHFKVRESINYSEKMCNIITPLLAQKIMPEVGLLCIRENPELLVAWLSILAHDENTDDDLCSSFKIYNRKFQEKRKKRLGKVIIDFELVESLMAGEAFWKWLKEGIKDKKIEVNKAGSHVHKVAGGYFIDYQELARKFSSIYSDKFPSWTVVVKQFNSLGVAKLSGGDYKYEQFFGDRGKYSVSGMFGDKRSSGIAKLPSGIVIEDSRGLISGKTTNSDHMKALGTTNVDKDLQSRANSVYGVNTAKNPNYEPPNN